MIPVNAWKQSRIGAAGSDAGQSDSPDYPASNRLIIRALVRPGVGPIDLTVNPGECVVVQGPSGAGKTLFLRALVDLDPNEGEVGLGDMDRDRTPAPEWRRRLAYVAAAAGWWEENVGRHFLDPAASGPLVERLGLPASALDWQVERLSTGERQRLALARALAGDPAALLLDEPTSGLDPDSMARVEAVLRERLDHGMPMILVTHDERQALRLGHRRYRMVAGRLDEEEKALS